MEQENLRGYQNGSKGNRRSPLENRESNDIIFSVFFYFTFVVWLAGVIYALVPVQGVERAEGGLIDSGKSSIVAAVYMFILLYGILGPVWMSLLVIVTIVVILGSIRLAMFKPEKFCFLARGALTFYLFLYMFEIYQRFSDYLDSVVIHDHRTGLSKRDYDNNIFNMTESIPSLVVKAVFVLAALYCITTKKYAHAVDHVAKAAKSFYRVPSFVLFSLLIFIVAVILFVFYFWALYLAIFVTFTKFAVCLVLLLPTTAYLICFLYYFGLATLSLAAANREWSESQGSSPTTSVFTCAAHILRYKCGTVAYTATGVGPFISAILAWLRTNKTHIPTGQRSTFTKILDVVYMAFLLFNNANYTLIVSTIEGTNFRDSITKVFQHFKKQGATLYSFVWVIYGAQASVYILLLLFLGLVTYITAIVTIVQGDTQLAKVVLIVADVTTTVSLLTICLPIYMVLNAVGLTSYFYRMTVEEETNGVQDKMSAVPLRQA